MISYNDTFLRKLEKEILFAFDCNCGVFDDYTHYGCLLELRKNILNDQALMRKNQEKLMPHIIAFNEALRDALKHMYDRAHGLYHQMSAIQPDIELIAKCYLANNYPLLHPYQEEDRQDLWDALCDSGWNQLYDDGVSFPLVLPRDIKQSFDALIGMDCPPPNWNEGLDRELTKDCHLIQQFHHLFEHTKFAITDFIFCRDFGFEYSIITEEKTTNKEQ